jgi:hypothetical protein
MNDRVIIPGDLYNDLLEYFESRMDADYDYVSGKHSPNKEMKLFIELQECEAMQTSEN